MSSETQLVDPTDKKISIKMMLKEMQIREIIKEGQKKYNQHAFIYSFAGDCLAMERSIAFNCKTNATNMFRSDIQYPIMKLTIDLIRITFVNI